MLERNWILPWSQSYSNRLSNSRVRVVLILNICIYLKSACTWRLRILDVCIYYCLHILDACMYFTSACTLCQHILDVRIYLTPDILPKVNKPISKNTCFYTTGSLVLKLGDAVIPYHEDFKFYVTTKLPNPHYTPEVSTKVTLVNFTLSPSGLEDQLLGGYLVMFTWSKQL